MSIYVIFGIIALASYLVQARLNSKFEKYSKEAIPNGLRGCDVAQRMLAQYGLHDVRVTQVGGRLTDHYNPTDKTVNLSPEVYNGNSVAAAAVAAVNLPLYRNLRPGLLRSWRTFLPEPHWMQLK